MSGILKQPNTGLGDTALHSLANSARRNRWNDYLVAVAVAVLVLLCRAAVEPLVENDYLFVLALLGVVLVSWRSGFVPGVATLLLSMAGMVYFFVPPRYSFAITGFGNLLATSMFFFCGICCAGLGETQRLAHRRAKAALSVALERKGELEVEVARRREAEFAIRERELELIELNRKLAESQVQIIEDRNRQAETLEKMVQERTAELLNEVEERRRIELQLRDIAVELNRSNKELEQFAYVASHDLQEPLRKIQAFGDRLKTKFGEVLPDAGKEYVERMHSSASRMRRLIEDLLTFSRVTTQARSFVRVDLRKLAQEVVSDLDEYIEQNGGAVEVADLPFIDADPSQMRQLFQNLIANSIKFHRADVPPVVAIDAEMMEMPFPNPNGDLIPSCRICVRDNGIGFDEKYLSRIFQVFQRLHGREEYEGTGVGLAICRKIVERHGGTITAHSQVNKGSTFIVTLPIRHTAQEALPDVRTAQELSHNSDGRR
jgi:signal transduction histidine kinase